MSRGASGASGIFGCITGYWATSLCTWETSRLLCHMVVSELKLRSVRALCPGTRIVTIFALSL